MINAREDLYEEAKYLFDELGLDIDTAVNIYLAACLREGGIPFELKLKPYFDKILNLGCNCEDCECENCECGCMGHDCDCEECDHVDCNCGCEDNNF